MSATVINATHEELVAQLVHRFTQSQADNREMVDRIIQLEGQLEDERERYSEAHEECIELMRKVEWYESSARDVTAAVRRVEDAIGVGRLFEDERELILPTLIDKSYEGVGGTVTVNAHAQAPTSINVRTEPT